MYILVCAWVSLNVPNDYLIINRLGVCSLSILPPKIHHKESIKHAYLGFNINI